MEYSPPPLFKQGPSALVRLIFFVLLAVVLLVSDAHFHTLRLVRQVVSTALYPIQRAALVPRDMAYGALSYFVSSETLRKQNAELAARNLQLGMVASRAVELGQENTHLRALLQLSDHSVVKPVPAEIQYDTRDPFSQKVIVDKGIQAGVTAGSPVINEDGLVGQVTRIFPLQSEVTLLTDRDQAVPVQIVRTGVRSVVYGNPSGDLLDLRFLPTGADIVPGDELVTSGLDGVYPAGLPVARVLQVERQSESAFAKVTAAPIARIRGVRQMLILHYTDTLPPNPVAALAASEAAAAPRSRHRPSASSGATAASAPSAASGSTARTGTAPTAGGANGASGAVNAAAPAAGSPATPHAAEPSRHTAAATATTAATRARRERAREPAAR